MKKIIVALCNMAAVLAFVSCSKDSGHESGPVPPGSGKVTPVGTVLNAPVTKQTISPAGGSVTSEDGRVTLEFPSGALASATEITITPITDENPMGGEQQAYRLQPHGLTFLKPVKIRFNYSPEDYRHSIPEALGIAYQDEEGIWQSQGGVLDKSAQTLTITTDHFSDWSFFEEFKLLPAQASVAVNGTVQLRVESSAFYVPLAPGEHGPVGEAVDMTASFIKKWKLAGAGNLQSNGAKATYKAPATVPTSQNPVAVSVEFDFKRRGQFIVVSNITIQDDFGEIEVSVGGGPMEKRKATPAVKVGNNAYAVSDNDGDEVGSYIFITWEGGVGSHAFREPGASHGTHAHYEVIDGANFVCYYIHPVTGQLTKSMGGVTITNMGDQDGFVEGSFQISPAGIGPDMLTTTTVGGKFKVRRGF